MTLFWRVRHFSVVEAFCTDHSIAGSWHRLKAEHLGGSMHAKVENLETGRGFCELFDLESEISALMAHKPWPQGMTSKMLLKTDDLRIVLIVMQAGARMNEHHSDGRISIQVLRGAVRTRVQDQVVDLSPGRLLALDRSIKHEVEARDDSAFLLTIVWPSNEELVGLKHRGYGS